MTDRRNPIIFLFMAQTISQQFRDQIEGYLTESGMDPTNFGRAVMGDPRFVFDLRKGRAPSSRTMDRVCAWIEANPLLDPDLPSEPNEATA